MKTRPALYSDGQVIIDTYTGRVIEILKPPRVGPKVNIIKTTRTRKLR